MSDFVAGYVSGAASILLGSPLDILKVHLQDASPRSAITAATPLLGDPPARARMFPTAGSMVRGTLYPVLGYGALNALLFGSYTRFLDAFAGKSPDTAGLGMVWIAGAMGGLATWGVSTPTEMIKTRAQLIHAPTTSREIFTSSGINGFFRGGGITAARDAIGYGFYFWSYEVLKRNLAGKQVHENVNVLISGGIAGMVTWLSIYPLDVIKTRVQGQVVGAGGRWKSARAIAAEMFRGPGGGWLGSVFWGGIGVCMLRAAIVNAVQWAVYEEVLKLWNQEESVPLGIPA